MPAGRPSKYSPAYCEEIVNFCSEGGSITAFAGEIGVDRDTISEWAKVHPEFSASVKRAKAKLAAWWDAQARSVAKDGGTGGRATMVIFGLKNHAPDDYRDKQTIEHEGSISINTMTDAALDERIVAGLMATGLSREQAEAVVARPVADEEG